MLASLLQLAGLVAVTAGACVLAGFGGLLVGGGVTAVYVGLAVEGRR